MGTPNLAVGPCRACAGLTESWTFRYVGAMHTWSDACLSTVKESRNLKACDARMRSIGIYAGFRL